MMEFFLKNTQLVASEDMNWWTSVVDYCDVVISCLDSHSDANATFLQIF